MQDHQKFPITRNQLVSPEKVRLAKKMRRDMTPSEALLWDRLRGSALAEIHFRRQQIIAGFIVDFYCVAAKLAVELDGPIHETQSELDRERDLVLTAFGIRALRFKNHEVTNEIEVVLQKIVAACASQT